MSEMNFLDFDSIQIGETRSLRKRISEKDVRAFVDLTGDTNPLHIDEGFAKRTSFQERVVHGMLGASFISTVIGTQLPGPGALWLSQSFQFLRPVRIDDELTISCTVTEKHIGERILDVDTHITNHLGQQVLSGVGRIQVLNLEELEEDAQSSGERRRVLITGATGGIGSAIAHSVAENGYDLVLQFHRNSDEAANLEKSIRAMKMSTEIKSLRADLSDERDVDLLAGQALEHFGRIDIVVNAASPRFGGSDFEKLAWREVERQIDVHTKAPYLLAQRLMPGMKAAGWGRIINISSDAALGSPTSGWTAYGIAKAGLVALTQYLANELGRYGITSNCVSPGMCRTPFIMDIPEKFQLVTARNTPTRRISEPRDIASLVAFLCKDESSQINGQTIHVNGGMRMV